MFAPTDVGAVTAALAAVLGGVGAICLQRDLRAASAATRRLRARAEVPTVSGGDGSVTCLMYATWVVVAVATARAAR